MFSSVIRHAVSILREGQHAALLEDIVLQSCNYCPWHPEMLHHYPGTDSEWHCVSPNSKRIVRHFHWFPWSLSSLPSR